MLDSEQAPSGHIAPRHGRGGGRGGPRGRGRVAKAPAITSESIDVSRIERSIVTGQPTPPPDTPRLESNALPKQVPKHNKPKQASPPSQPKSAQVPSSDPRSSTGPVSSSFADTEPSSRGRGTGLNRGRGRGNRGGLGKFLRARGRGHRGGGRPAEFGHRLLLEGEGGEEYEEAQEKLTKKYSRRGLGTNVERYEEKKDDVDEEAEIQRQRDAAREAEELARFMERQRLADASKTDLLSPHALDAEDDIDPSLSHISSRGIIEQKKVVQEIEWDDEIESMAREKEEADASRELTARFRAKSDKLRRKPIAPTKRERKIEASYVAAPALPTDKPKDGTQELEDFLDDLIS